MSRENLELIFYMLQIVVGNGTSPTSAGTTSLSGNSLNSDENGRLKVEVSNNKKVVPSPVTPSAQPEITSNVPAPQKPEKQEEPNNTTCNNAPIASIDDADLKLDGGEVNNLASPPSCSRLDEASQACV